MTPTARIAWGIAALLIGLILILSAWPLGLLVLLGGAALVWIGIQQQKQPLWQIRAILRRAHQDGTRRAALLQQALEIDPDNPEALAACAENAFASDDWVSAAQLYERYLQKAPDDEQAEVHLGASYLNAGDFDRALVHLEKIRAKSDPAARPGLFNAVAMAFLKKGDPGQALEILKTLPLRRQALDVALQQGLLLRAMAHFGLHQASAASSDLDRLYAINPEYPGLQAIRDAMNAGTFAVASVPFQVGTT